MAVQISGNDITVPRDGTFSRNVSIAGTLTYEDVTNVDSIGLVTARNGIEIGARPGVAASISVDGNMIVSGVTTLGGEVQIPDYIHHIGDNNCKFGFESGDTFAIETAGSERVRVTSDGNLGIGTITPSGLLHTHTASGTNRNYIEASASNAFLRIKSGSTSNNSGVEFFSGSSNIANVTGMGAGGLQFEVGGSERVRIGSSGQIGIAGANYGTSGQVLTSQGSGSVVQWAAPTIYTEYSTQTVGGTDSYAITMSNDPKVFEVSLFEVRHGSSATIMYRLSNSGGETTSGYYDISSYFRHDHASNSTSRGLNQAQGCLVNYDFTGADNLMNGKAIFTKVNTGLYTFSGSYAMYFHADASNNDQYRIKSDGHIDNNQNSGSTVTQIRIFTSNGANFTSGSINVSGIA